MAVIETITFRLLADADESEFIEADQRMQTAFTYQQTGLMRRTTARGDSGDWIVVALWASIGDADAAAAASKDCPAVAAVTALVDPSTMTTARYTALD